MWSTQAWSIMRIPFIRAGVWSTFVGFCIAWGFYILVKLWWFIRLAIHIPISEERPEILWISSPNSAGQLGYCRYLNIRSPLKKGLRPPTLASVSVQRERTRSSEESSMVVNKRDDQLWDDDASINVVNNNKRQNFFYIVQWWRICGEVNVEWQNSEKQWQIFRKCDFQCSFTTK